MATEHRRITEFFRFRRAIRGCPVDDPAARATEYSLMACASPRTTRSAHRRTREDSPTAVDGIRGGAELFSSFSLGFCDVVGVSRLWTSADGSRVVIRRRRGPRAVSSPAFSRRSLRRRLRARLRGRGMTTWPHLSVTRRRRRPRARENDWPRGPAVSDGKRSPGCDCRWPLGPACRHA